MRYPRKRQARLRAAELLLRTRLKKPPVPVEEIAGSLGLSVRYQPLEGDLSGVLYTDKGQRLIGVNSLHHENRRRFTVAHEIGHFLLHRRAVDEQRVFVDHILIWRRDAASSRAESADEIEANQFAAELLVPARLLRLDVESGEYDLENDGDLRRLARRYGVSFQTLSYQLMWAGYVSGFGEKPSETQQEEGR